MYNPMQKLQTPSDFNFPYEPYAIQAELMKSLYEVLEAKKIGIFESPTGTGKSLTLTCAALRWLEDHERLVRQELQQKIAAKELELKQQTAENAKTADWLNAQYELNQLRAELKELKDFKSFVDDYDQGLNNIRKKENIRKQFKGKHKEKIPSAVSEDETLLEKQLKELDELDTKAKFEEAANDEKPQFYRDVQIFFCSRTHSQLTQVVREVKQTKYGKRIRCITLGSRQQLCVNAKVKNVSNTALINERCLELTQKSEKLTKCNEIEESNSKNTKNCGCPFKTPNAVEQLSATALVDICDIEELYKEGNEQKACAYYAARNAANTAAQLIMLPYQTLLHHRTRKRSGIDLTNAVVIIDEAHNLLDTIADLHSCELTLQQLQQARNAIETYKSRYEKLFGAANLLNIKQLLYVIRRLQDILEPKPVLGSKNNSVCKSRVLRTYQLSDEGEFFNIDLFKLLEFCESTRFVQKLQGFMKEPITKTTHDAENPATKMKENSTIEFLKRLEQDKLESCKPKHKKSSQNVASPTETATLENKEAPLPHPTAVPLYALISFLEALTEKAEDGRIILQVDGTPTGSLLRYVVLNPGNYFEDVIRQARAIVIAGGTMQPTNELTEQLFAKCVERVQLNFFDHVVSTEAVLPIIMQQGPAGKRLCFNFTQRGSAAMLLELSMALQNLCQVIPAGLVCFLPSYDYLDTVYEYLRSTEALVKINTKKCVFRETRAAQKGQSVEQLLKDYAAEIKHKGGALLLSVVGGKLSEGLNFKDDLCRGVIVVGMPYANSQSLELQERMTYMDKTLGAGAGNQYYENLCMKAVNQCIGRAVRHIKDYAAVYLLDERYTSEHIRNKLPQWIRRSLQMPTTYGMVHATTAKYFKSKKMDASGI